jgi:AcrR family transcriptional regulator
MDSTSATTRKQQSLPRKERERRFRLDLVLDVAEQVFDERGFHEAGVEEIARRAEFSVGTLYNLFASKEALFAAVVDRRQDEFLAEIQREIADEASPLAKLDRLAAFALHYFEAHETLFRAYVSATNGFMWSVRPTLGERTFQKQARFFDFVAAVCREGIEREEWPQADARSLALVVSATLNAFLTRWVVTERGSPLEPRLQELQSFIRRIVGMPAQEPPLPTERHGN